ncbi:Cysteine-rich repeat secretory protein 55 [Raphanus sativus]|nr:Cysteine-rich repeat secretory protein 55 [Raphanus sativus]
MKTFIVKCLLVLALVCSFRAADSIWNLCNKNSNISKSSQVSKNIDSLFADARLKDSFTRLHDHNFLKLQQERQYLRPCSMQRRHQQDRLLQLHQDAAKKIREICPNQSDSGILYDFCFLRYSQKNFIGKLDRGAGLIYYNFANVTETDPKTFDNEFGKAKT